MMSLRRPLALALSLAALSWLSPPAASADESSNAPAAQDASQINELQRQLDTLKLRNAAEQQEIEELERRLQSVRGGGQATASQAPATQEAQPGTQASGLVKQPPRATSVSNVYQEQNALFRRGLTVSPGFTYVYSDNRFFTLNGFLALGAVLLGSINVNRQQSSVVGFNVNSTYGLTPRLQLDLNLPFVMRNTTYVGAGANFSTAQVAQATTNDAQLGDVSAGFYYQLVRERKHRPAVVINTQVTAPTGLSPYGIKVVINPANTNLTYPALLPTGQGVWQVSGGATFIKTVDPAILFAGFNYYHNLAGHFDDISPTQNLVTPGEAVPGDSFGANIGTAFALNERVSTSFSFQDIFTSATRIRPDGQGWQAIAGSSLNAATLNLGMTYALNSRSSWVIQVGFGVTQDAPNVQFSMQFPHRY